MGIREAGDRIDGMGAQFTVYRSFVANFLAMKEIQIEDIFLTQLASFIKADRRTKSVGRRSSSSSREASVAQKCSLTCVGPGWRPHAWTDHLQTFRDSWWESGDRPRPY